MARIWYVWSGKEKRTPGHMGEEIGLARLYKVYQILMEST